MLRILGLLAAIVVPGCSGTAVTEPTIRLADGRFEVFVDATLDDPPEWHRRFLVRVHGAGPDTPRMLGDYKRDGALLAFTPRFPLTPGLRYAATLSAGATTSTRVFLVPQRDSGPPIVVEQIFPSAETLPENVLRFYVQFSGPMSLGDSYTHIALLDERGERIELPFLEIAEELWNPSGTRLTLLVDPGRIKNELLPKRQVGPVFHESGDYTLQIAAAWPDAAGRPLAAPFRKRIRIGPAASTQPDPKKWKLSSPRASTKDTLTIGFPDSLDRGMLERMIEIVGPDGRTVPGEIEVLGHETLWRFVPAESWAKGPHHLVVDTELEDVAGNSIRAPFEVDVFGETKRRIEKTTVRVPIRLR